MLPALSRRLSVTQVCPGGLILDCGLCLYVAEHGQPLIETTGDQLVPGYDLECALPLIEERVDASTARAGCRRGHIAWYQGCSTGR